MTGMAITDLKFDEPGSLPKPGPVGRVARLVFGTLCFWYVVNLIQVSGNMFDVDGHIRAAIWNGMIIGLFLVSYTQLINGKCVGVRSGIRACYVTLRIVTFDLSEYFDANIGINYEIETNGTIG